MNYQSPLKNLQDWAHESMTWFSNSTSAMDVQTAVICGGVFVFSALVVYLISVFGMRERTYEEAMEEQRRRNQGMIHHTKSDKSKKEKRFRKWGKKSKEKVEDEKSPSGDGENKAPSEESETKGEVDVISTSSSNLGPKVPSLRKRVRQRKAMVLGKEEDCSQPISSSEDTDDLPLLNGSSSISKLQDEPKLKTMDKSTEAKDDFKHESFDLSAEIQSAFREKSEMAEMIKPLRRSPSKKKKKSDLLDFGFESREGTDCRISTILKGTSFTDDEVQHIIEALGAKQKANEKKKSEISTYKKIILEKEDLLRTEQKISQSANERISELLQEFGEEKAQSTATEKSLREALNQEQQEIKALHGMMQRKREQYSSEMASLQSKMQQMKNKMKDDHTMAIQGI